MYRQAQTDSIVCVATAAYWDAARYDAAIARLRAKRAANEPCREIEHVTLQPYRR
jgi:hypothetical protein